MDVVYAAKAILFCAFLTWAGVGLANRSCEEALDDQPPRRLAAPQILRGQLCQPDGACVPALLWAGPIPAGTSDLYLSRIADLQQYPDGTQAHWICLWSGGGSVEASEDLGRTLKFMNLNTCVVPVEEPVNGALWRVPRNENGILCASACVAMFLGGKRKTMHPQAALGVHRSRIDGPVSCTPYVWRGHVADFSQTMRRIMIGSPWRLEAMLEWHAMRTSHDSITTIRGAQIAEVTNAGVTIAPAVWRPLGASSHETAPETRVSALATQITSKGASE